MLLLPPELNQRVQALLHQAVHPQASFAAVNEAILRLQSLPEEQAPEKAAEEERRERLERHEIELAAAR